MLSLAPGGSLVWIDSIYDPAVTDGEGRAVPHRWSADGSRLAVIGKQWRDEPYASTAYVVTASNNGVQRLTDRTLHVEAAVWSTTG